MVKTYIHNSIYQRYLSSLFRTNQQSPKLLSDMALVILMEKDPLNSKSSRNWQNILNYHNIRRKAQIITVQLVYICCVLIANTVQIRHVLCFIRTKRIGHLTYWRGLVHTGEALYIPARPCTYRRGLVHTGEALYIPAMPLYLLTCRLVVAISWLVVTINRLVVTTYGFKNNWTMACPMRLLIDHRLAATTSRLTQQVDLSSQIIPKTTRQHSSF